MAINIRLDKYYTENVNRLKGMCKDDRAWGEIEDAINRMQTTDDIIHDDCWDGDIQYNGDYISLETLFECLEAVIAYEHGYEGNDYWRETYK